MADEQVTAPHVPAASTPDPNGANTAVQTPAERARIGPLVSAVPAVHGFEVLGELGRGGMGVVYHARQTGLNRDAALKMVLGSDTADPKELIRFLAEAEAVAAVKHPNVVQVYEYGDHAGRPFIALEYLPNGSLGDRLKSGPLAPDHAADIVEKLAHGMHAAHLLGIVHRDLKPANVLFDAADEPKVTDFGLAKRGAGTDLTHTNAVMGTPAYMAPEQAQGEAKFAGPPADVWALGVILYQCLTGNRPFVSDGNMAVLQRITSTEPPAPRKHNPAVPRDLELICLKCLRKEPHERYPNGGALAADLRAYAEGRPVSARPVPGIVRAWKWAKRNPTYAALSLGLALALVAGTAVSWWQATRANGETVKANQQKAATEVANRELEVANGKLEIALGQVTTEKENVQKELTARVAADGRTYNALDALTPVARNAFARKSKLTPEDRAFIARIIDLHKNSAPVGGTSPESQFLVANAHLRVGDLSESLGELGEAETEYGAARRAFEQLAKEFPTNLAYRESRLTACQSLGVLLDKTARRAEAEALLRESRDGFRALSAGAPSDFRLHYRHAVAAGKLANLFAHEGRFKEAEDAYEVALKELMGALAGAQQANASPREIGVAFAACADEVAAIYKQTDQYPKAEEAYRLAFQAVELLIKGFPNDALLREAAAAARQNLAGVLQLTGRQKDAELHYQFARVTYANLVAEFPGTPEYRYKLAQVYMNLGMMYREQRRLKDAEQPLRLAIDLSEQLATAHPESLDYAYSAALAHGNFSLLAEYFNRPDDARAEAKLAADRFRKLAARAPTVAQYRGDLALTLGNLAGYADRRKQPDEARGYREEALPHLREALRLNPKNPFFAGAHRYALEFLIGDRIGRGIHDGVPELAAERLAAAPNRTADLPATASVLAQCIPLVRADARLTDDQKGARTAALADAVMKHLEEAADAWFLDTARLRFDPAFAPLRSRPDYRRLMDRIADRIAPPPREVKP